MSSDLKKAGTALIQLSKSFRLLKDELSIVDKRIGEDLCWELENKITTKYEAYLQKPYIDKKQNRGGYPFVWTEPLEDGRFKVHVQGHQVIYDEFGTGERGLNNPHPAKNSGGQFGEWNFVLKDYNSGDHIKWSEKHHTHYWIWRGPHFGEPAGAFVYNSIMELYDEKNGIAHEDVNQIYKKIPGFKK